MNKLITAAAVSAGILLSTPALASNVDVEITNLTNGLYFTPLLVAAHDYDTHLFQAGTDAVGTNVQAMAEGGDISGLIGEVEASGGAYVANPAEGLLAPGESTTATLKTRGRHNTHLSITAMLLPTNDGFVGLDGLMIPKKKGTYTYLIDAYDAGTEDNDELIVGMPGGAPGTPGSELIVSQNAGFQPYRLQSGAQSVSDLAALEMQADQEIDDQDDVIQSGQHPRGQ